ncbi:DsbA family oxidoreductase [Halalkalibacter hemicellulosilyticus]|uniref:2-hydroxychromene-2-carboxylate isomerase/DsbA-like thioredoxin domain n=1 Tax=Halalkalibacter hemicellulosilyticusJCM 9152 TaxID=1236971 RepID=W4QD52_9BACI|nr:DsbA family oxidoreductase [Halalkalibacter hemicellulosilyticus]GAE29960.1 2-hydroxychromene-2-carboxylate isomerase/DsbA-like thioredoxin domain [Halalkalibacter hemicellulosilyticusJCM 9152]
MIIEMWTDFACPFCYIGKRRLEEALKQIEEPIEVVYRSFELDPDADGQSKETIYEMLAKKYGMSLAEARANTENVKKMAAEVGLDFNFDQMVVTNTFDAHRLALYAYNKGLMQEVTERILHAHFSEGKHIGNHSTLIQLATEVGLDQEAVSALLESEEMTELVRKDEQQATEYGIRSVPFFLINQKYAITGAQPTDTFVQSIKQILEQDQPLSQKQMDGEGTCNNDGCSV